MTAIAYSRALETGRPGRLLRARHAVFDRLVYARLREALGGRCAYAVSGGAPLGERLGHFYRGIGVTVLEGYGLTETTAAVTVNIPDALKIGTVGRRSAAPPSGWPRTASCCVRGGQVLTGYWQDAEATARGAGRATAGCAPATWARSTTRASCGSPAARRRSWLPQAARTSLRPGSRTRSGRTRWSASAWSSATAARSSRRWSPSTPTRSAPGPRRTARARTCADLVDDPDLRAEVQSAVDEANRTVSQAESIRRFTMLPVDWTEEAGQLTPSLKLKRARGDERVPTGGRRPLRVSEPAGRSGPTEQSTENGPSGLFRPFPRRERSRVYNP